MTKPKTTKTDTDALQEQFKAFGKKTARQRAAARQAKLLINGFEIAYFNFLREYQILIDELEK